jgi:hypothetical protein
MLMTDETCSLLAPAVLAASAHEAATRAAAEVIAECIFLPVFTHIVHGNTIHIG